LIKSAQNDYIKGSKLNYNGNKIRVKNGANLNNARRKISETFTKKREYQKERINDVERNSKNKNIRYIYRGINEFKWGYHRRSILLKNENGDLLADSHTILNIWKNYSSQLLKSRNVPTKFPE
jgi:hypothetical protein